MAIIGPTGLPRFPGYGSLDEAPASQQRISPISTPEARRVSELFINGSVARLPANQNNHPDIVVNQPEAVQPSSSCNKTVKKILIASLVLVAIVCMIVFTHFCPYLLALALLLCVIFIARGLFELGRIDSGTMPMVDFDQTTGGTSVVEPAREEQRMTEPLLPEPQERNSSSVKSIKRPKSE